MICTITKTIVTITAVNTKCIVCGFTLTLTHTQNPKVSQTLLFGCVSFAVRKCIGENEFVAFI